MPGTISGCPCDEAPAALSGAEYKAGVSSRTVQAAEQRPNAVAGTLAVTSIVHELNR
jgi:hypothetical protein